MHSRANPEELLRGKAFQLIFPTGLAGVVVVAVAAYYFTLTVALPPGTERTFYVLTAAVAATVIAWLSLRARARLAKTVALSRGALPPTEEHLADAAREVFGMPDALFVYVVHNWLVGGVSLGLSFKLFCPEVSWAMSGRVLTLALIFGALNALLSQIVTTAPDPDDALRAVRLRALAREAERGDPDPEARAAGPAADLHRDLGLRPGRAQRRRLGLARAARVPEDGRAHQPGRARDPGGRAPGRDSTSRSRSSARSWSRSRCSRPGSSATRSAARSGRSPTRRSRSPTGSSPARR